MRKRFKKVMSLFVVVLMMATSLPITAFAENDNKPELTWEMTKMAAPKTNEKSYSIGCVGTNGVDLGKNSISIKFKKNGYTIESKIKIENGEVYDLVKLEYTYGNEIITNPTLKKDNDGVKVLVEKGWILSRDKWEVLDENNLKAIYKKISPQTKFKIEAECRDDKNKPLSISPKQLDITIGNKETIKLTPDNEEINIGGKIYKLDRFEYTYIYKWLFDTYTETIKNPSLYNYNGSLKIRTNNNMWIPFDKLNLKAIYKEKEKYSHKVHYCEEETNNSLSEDSSVSGYENQMVIIPVIELKGYELVNPNQNEVKIDNSGKEINVYYKKKAYNITFNTGDFGNIDGDKQKVVKVKFEEAFPSLPKIDIVTEGYRHVGWDKEIPEKVTESVEYTATYEIDKTKRYVYDVYCYEEGNDVSLLTTTTSVSGYLTQELDLEIPEIKGFIAVPNNPRTIKVEKTTGGIVILRYTRNNMNVTFNAGDHGTISGSREVTLLVKFDEAFPIDKVPTVNPASRYKFIGWGGSFPDKVTENVVYTALYKKKTSGATEESSTPTTNPNSSGGTVAKTDGLVTIIDEEVPLTDGTNLRNVTKFSELTQELINKVNGFLVPANKVEGITIPEGITVASIAGKTSEFKDINNHWAADSIRRAVELGLLNGVGEFEFAPKAPLTMEQTLVGISNVLLRNDILNMKMNKSDLEKQFASMLSNKTWSTLSVVQVLGSTDKETVDKIANNPSILKSVMTRQAMAELIFKLGKDIIPNSSNNAIEFCKETGIMMGDKDGNFYGERTLSRAELASILLRIDEKLANI